MIGRLNHVAIAVRDIAKASELYRDTLGAQVSAVVPQPDHGVNTVFIALPNTKIELLEPLGDTARAECTPLHRGRTTMVWQTRITRGDGRLAAIVTQTQLVLKKSA